MIHSSLHHYCTCCIYGLLTGFVINGIYKLTPSRRQHSCPSRSKHPQQSQHHQVTILSFKTLSDIIDKVPTRKKIEHELAKQENKNKSIYLKQRSYLMNTMCSMQCPFKLTSHMMSFLVTSKSISCLNISNHL